MRFLPLALQIHLAVIFGTKADIMRTAESIDLSLIFNYLSFKDRTNHGVSLCTICGNLRIVVSAQLGWAVGRNSMCRIQRRIAVQPPHSFG